MHVEAGLRTGDLMSPWPEEFNRRIATLSTSLHCAPTEYAASKLFTEGVRPETVGVTGNPVVDALRWTLAKLSAANSSHTSDRPRVVLTAHRRENFGRPLENICSAVLELAEKFSNHEFHFITHPNPQAGPVVRSILDGRSAVRVVPPLSYPEFISLMAGARLLISDSGGIQEEAPTLGIPLLVTRESTERPEVVHCGAAELVGTDRDHIIDRAIAILSRPPGERNPRPNPFGDGRAGERIIEAIVDRFSHRAGGAEP
ncbi:MAG: UDP-N-acetylglucosamine 2-epimerase (non-hydrolyzing) [Pirellulales bacterium]